MINRNDCKERLKMAASIFLGAALAFVVVVGIPYYGQRRARERQADAAQKAWAERDALYMDGVDGRLVEITTEPTLMVIPRGIEK